MGRQMQEEEAASQGSQGLGSGEPAPELGGAERARPSEASAWSLPRPSSR